MKTVIGKAYAKINLILNVGKRRQDGYHELRTIFQEIDLHDEISLIGAKKGIRLKCYGFRIPSGKDNLAYRAAIALLPSAGDQEYGATIVLRKNIPPGTGLGGGSSDAAFVLKGLNRLWNLHFSLKQLQAIGKQLGSDVCFFLQGGTALGKGRGEKVCKIYGFPHTWLVLAWPGFPSSTVSAYGGLKQKTLKLDRRVECFCRVLRNKRFNMLTDYYHNDLEGPVSRRYPLIHTLKQCMMKAGASAAHMSGSGSVVFGIVRNCKEAAIVACRIKGLAKKVWIAQTR